MLSWTCMYISIYVQELNEILKIVWSKFHPGCCYKVCSYKKSVYNSVKKSYCDIVEYIVDKRTYFVFLQKTMNARPLCALVLLLSVLCLPEPAVSFFQIGRRDLNNNAGSQPNGRFEYSEKSRRFYRIHPQARFKTKAEKMTLQAEAQLLQKIHSVRGTRSRI